MEHALACLRKIKHEIVSKKFQEADMWCHIGTAIIREPDEGEKRIKSRQTKLERRSKSVVKIETSVSTLLDCMNSV